MKNLFLLMLSTGCTLALYAGGPEGRLARLGELQRLETAAESLVPTQAKGKAESYLRSNPKILMDQIDATLERFAETRKEAKAGSQAAKKELPRIYKDLTDLELIAYAYNIPVSFR